MVLLIAQGSVTQEGNGGGIKDL